MSISGVASLSRRLDKVEWSAGQRRRRLFVVEGPYGGDFSALIAEKISTSRARASDLFVCVHRFADWNPE